MAKKNKRESSKASNSKPKKPQKSSVNSKSYSPLIILGIVISCLLLFANTFNHDFTVDDELVILKNKLVQEGIPAIGKIWTSSYLQGFNGEKDGSYRPVSITSFAIEKSLFNATKGSMHIMHVLYFLISVLLCYFFSFKLFNGNQTIAIVTTALFLCHPIHTEVVNNLKSRDEIMLLLGIMGTGNFYLKYLSNKKITSLIAAMAFYFIAVFSKESAITFFLMIPILYHWYRPEWDKTRFIHALFFFGISLLYLLVRLNVVGGVDLELTFMNNALLQSDDGFFERFPNAMALMGKYLFMLIFPYPLSFDYSYNSVPMNGWSSVWPYLSILIYGAMAYFAIDGIRKKKIYGVLIPWFLLTIVVSSNVLILIGSTFAERFLFVPSFAFCAAIAFYLYQFLDKKAMYVGIAIALLYSVFTFMRNQDWKTNIDLVTRDIKFQEENARMQNLYGRFTHVASADEQEDKKSASIEVSKEAFGKAINIAPDYWLTYYYQGLLAVDIKDNDQALKSFSKVVEMEDDFKEARLQYAIALRKDKDYKKAVDQYLWLVENNHARLSDYNNTGFCYFQLKDYDNALKYYLEGHKIDPHSKVALSALLRLYETAFRDPVKANIYRQKLSKLN